MTLLLRPNSRKWLLKPVGEEDDADYSDEENDGVDMFDDEDTPPEDDEEDGESEEDVYMGQGQYSNDVGKDYIPASDDVLAKEYIQPTGTQIISSCFPATLEYVNHLLGRSINEGVYQMQYFYQTSKFIFTSGGISPQEAENLICFNFEVVWYSNVKEAIDEGAVVFSSICNLSNLKIYFYIGRNLSSGGREFNLF